MEKVALANAQGASEVFAATCVPSVDIDQTSKAFSDAYAMRKAALRRAVHPATAPKEKASANVDGPQASAGQLILHSSNNASGAEGARNVDGLASATTKRSRVEDAIISMDAEVLRNKTRNKDEAIGEPEKPHAKWKLKTAIRGHSAPVTAVAVDPSNEWFATGSMDSTIRVYALATGKLKIQPLTGHSSTVRAINISKRAPLMFTGSEDHTVKLWDLETNRVVGDFFGHKAGVTSVASHPDLDLVASGSYDRTVKLWDVRTKKEVMSFRGHEKDIYCVAMQNCEPQIVSGGADKFVYLWDVKAGRAYTRLTRHREAVHSITIHHSESTMVTVGADHVRKWKLPDGDFFTNMNNTTIPNAPQAGLWNTSCVNADNVLFVGSRDGKMRFYDYGSHRLYQHTETKSVKGALPGEAGIRCATFDVSGTRLLTGEGDKMLKIWGQVGH